jgi:hypothetical protein
MNLFDELNEYKTDDIGSKYVMGAPIHEIIAVVFIGAVVVTNV